MVFRDLRADEIEVRVGSIKKDGTGLSLLLYKDARCDMAILDETVGAENWQRDHFECKGNLFCRVGVRYKDEWIWKADCGTESNTEKEKGESSDSFKRGCVCHGIGRELYSAPFIWVNSQNCKIYKNQKGTFKCDDDFCVCKIEIVNKKIVDLEIYNNSLKRVVYKMNGKVNTQPTTQPATPTIVTCPKCGKPMQPMTTAKRTVWQPQQILSKYGMCKDCYEASK